MKKTLLSIFGALAASSAIAQASASWATTQNANWPIVSAGVRHFSAVDANVVWAHGYDGTAPSRNYCWYTRSINGGTSFNSGPIFTSTTSAVDGDTTTYQIGNMEGVDANTCWVSSFLKVPQNKGAIHRTTDGGATWVNMTAPGMYTNSASFCDLVTFLTTSVGVTMGDPNGVGNEFEIWRTTDGGTTWTVVPGANIPNPVNSSEYGLTGVFTKYGTTNIWFGTNKGRIYRSTDAGVTWNVSTLDASSQGISEIAFTTPNNGYAWLIDASQTIQTYTTINGGATWNLIPVTDPNLGLNNMCAIPGTAHYASAGAGTANQIISYSGDGGNTWTDWGSVGIQYLTVDFVDGSTGWAGGFSDPTTVGLGGIYKYSGPTISSTAPIISFSVPPTGCIGSAITTTNNTTSTITPLSYFWSIMPSTAAFSSYTATAPTFTANAAGVYTISLQAANSTATISSTQTISILCVGINETAKALNAISVFPNPSNGLFSVANTLTDDNISYSVVNILGSVVTSGKFSGTKNIDLSGQSKGIYFITFENNGSKISKKITIE